MKTIKAGGGWDGPGQRSRDSVRADQLQATSWELDQAGLGPELNLENISLAGSNEPTLQNAPTPQS
jgi:hypothetical protein